MLEPQNLSVRCPSCENDLAKIYVSSRTVVTVTCVRCNYIWCADLDAMTASDRAEAQVAILAREQAQITRD